MGEIAEMMLDGTLCECCGVYMDDYESGHPRRCARCNRDEGRSARRELKTGTRHRSKKPVCKCPICGKWVKLAGINDHLRDKHEPGPLGEIKGGSSDSDEAPRGIKTDIPRGIPLRKELTARKDGRF